MTLGLKHSRIKNTVLKGVDQHHFYNRLKAINFNLKRRMQTILHIISVGSLIQCGPGSSRGFRLRVSALKGGRNSINKCYLIELSEPFSPAGKQSPLSWAWQELYRKNKKVLSPFGEMPVPPDEILGSSAFSLLALLSAAFSQFPLGILKYTVVCV